LGGAIFPTWKGFGVLLYVAVFTSILGQLFWIRAVELIGPGRAGVFQNLVPVIGALMAVVLLREDFHGYHAVSLALVLGGLMISERLGKR
jgi:drug/metabolite transporter (DMT)-like permease